MIPPVQRSLTGWMGLYLRGVGMGVAELVPGVSGGTIAFITGIYQELVAAVRGIGLGLLAPLRARAWRALWLEHRLGFLLVLGAGMGSGILLLATGVQWLLEFRAMETAGFFFGLIFASIFVVGASVKPWTPTRGGLALLGVVIGFGVSSLPMAALTVSPLTILLGGALAICAWILPGVSGSFLLLLLGLYPHVVEAVAERDLVFLGILAMGCSLGLLLFSRFLTWLLERAYGGTLALLVGFMAGSVRELWPWSVAHNTLAAGTSAPGVLGSILLGLLVVLATEGLARRGR